jgi:hypothetical protein
MTRKVDFSENPHHPLKRYIMKSVNGFLIMFFHCCIKLCGLRFCYIVTVHYFETCELIRSGAFVGFLVFNSCALYTVWPSMSIHLCECVLNVSWCFSPWVCPVNEFYCVKVEMINRRAAQYSWLLCTETYSTAVLEECRGSPCGCLLT